jgi:hypothetical protein
MVFAAFGQRLPTGAAPVDREIRTGGENHLDEGRAVPACNVVQQGDAAESTEVLGHNHVASCAEMLDNRYARSRDAFSGLRVVAPSTDAPMGCQGAVPAVLADQ